MARIAGQLADLTEAVQALTTAIKGPEHKPDEGLVWRVTHLDGRRRVFDKILLAVLISLAVGLIGWLAKISYIVQSAKVP